MIRLPYCRFSLCEPLEPSVDDACRYLSATDLLTATVWFSGPAIIISWWVLLLTSLHGNHFSMVYCDLFPEPRNGFGVPLELFYGEPGVPGLDWSRTEKFLYNHRYSNVLVLQIAKLHSCSIDSILSKAHCLRIFYYSLFVTTYGPTILSRWVVLIYVSCI